MRVLALLRFIAVLSTGLVAGIYLGDRMGASFARPELSPSSFVKFQQIQHVHFVKMMPVLLGLDPVQRGVVGSDTVSRQMPGVRVRGSGNACLHLRYRGHPNGQRAHQQPAHDVGCFFTAGGRDGDLGAWERMHSVRTFLAILGFGFELVALRAPENFPEP